MKHYLLVWAREEAASSVWSPPPHRKYTTYSARLYRNINDETEAELEFKKEGGLCSKIEDYKSAYTYNTLTLIANRIKESFGYNYTPDKKDPNFNVLCYTPKELQQGIFFERNFLCRKLTESEWEILQDEIVKNVLAPVDCSSY